jgi:hypothetical protein
MNKKKTHTTWTFGCIPLAMLNRHRICHAISISLDFSANLLFLGCVSV